MAPIHEQSAFYDLEGFRRGGIRLRDYEIEEIGPVKDKELLHVQCHFGIDTLSWARLGARVTGADFSDRGVELARSLAAELGIDARFVVSNV
ncbi:MAG: SAM-dependent methyltransferase, partial [Chloroflexi bacterium]